MAKTSIGVRSVGLSAPGLPSWAEARAVLCGEALYAAVEPPPYQPQLLPPNERRRATPAIREAFRVAEDATTNAAIDPSVLATVFATSDADLGIIHRMSSALAEPTRHISPTDFHNSVHNAASGYWSIATRSRLPSSTLCAYDASFAAGLIDAATMVAAEDLDTLLVVYDVPGPPVLDEQRHFGCAAGSALVLSARGDGIAHLALSIEAGTPTRMDDPPLEALRLANPALRALPLLQLLARGQSGTVFIESPAGTMLRIDVTPG